jgi:hypothetical protein
LQLTPTAAGLRPRRGQLTHPHPPPSADETALGRAEARAAPPPAHIIDCTAAARPGPNAIWRPLRGPMHTSYATDPPNRHAPPTLLRVARSRAAHFIPPPAPAAACSAPA